MPVFAFLVLLFYPLVVAVLFARLDRVRALIWSILAGYLLLPQLIEIDLPGFPGLNKAVIPATAAAIAIYFGSDSRPRDALGPPPMGPWVGFLLAMLFTSPFLTAVTNPDPLIDGINYRPAMSLSQGVGHLILQVMQILPFLLGYKLLWNVQGARQWMRALVLGVLCYTVPMLIELRLSPQIHVWVYGYFQHDFIQTIRYGGYRPIVFLEHPLWVAVMTMTAFLAAIAFARNDPTRRNVLIALYLGCIVVLCKSAGALMQAMMAAPLVAFARPRAMVLMAVLVASVAFAYPTLRTTSWMPLQGIVDLAMSISPDRGRSLEFRLMNEEALLERAMERPLFGWGSWGRSLFYDPYSGRLASVPDGQWIIWVGARGIYGYLAHFLLLLTPIYMLFRAMPRGRDPAREPELVLLGCLSLMLAMNLLDLIPNATLTPLTWLTAGTLLGNARRLHQGLPQHEGLGQAVAVLPKKAGIQTLI
ncbi:MULTISPECIES: hypothetical protein [unclassified Paracoccus (in: a-proteobacteria)]|uniref:hypothetical protein n=1 Tax=unclassified Paracoccus (in: a-proteobacteria) TaxID=2688777 RepID=UPI001353016A|nr:MULTISPECIES: hypothetical protein [unclassified Paracoccus (in: a-proteobacteria)]UXU76138.1 hypothetical protein GB879_006595 [Paracoccus sp. SMMA_5]UXU82050.1 hypothetical protein GB880_006580 [Paracoccus sp. SMMA_5_TC]